MELRQVKTAREVETARGLFRAYADDLGVDLGFQGFPDELAGLPGPYAPPRGRLLLARAGGRLAGRVALKPLDGTTCEMKRLFIHPEFRGQGLGKGLVEAIIHEARTIGFRRMRLDSLPSMAAAQALYRALGFKVISPYVRHPDRGDRIHGTRS